MKINLIFNSFPKSSETFLLNLAIGLSRMGYDVNMVLLSVSDLEINRNHHNVKSELFKIRIIKSPFTSSARALIFILKRSKKIIKHFATDKKNNLREKLINFMLLTLLTENKPNIIYFAYSGIAIHFTEVLNLIEPKVKKIVSCRGSAEIYKPILDESRSTQLSQLWSKVDYVHCVSNDMLQRMCKYGLDRRKGFVNFPSVDIDKFQFIERSIQHLDSLSEKIIIVSTGRLNHQKGYLYALLAIRNLVFRGIKLEYHILGDGEEYGPLKYFIVENQLHNVVFLHGKVNSSKVRSVLAEAHIFLLPSVYEGISNAVLEAMASGVPIITTDSGGMNEVVLNGVNGIVVSRFEPTDIESAILSVIDDYPQAIRLASKARETVEMNFSLSRQIACFDQLFRNCGSQLTIC